MKMKLYFMPALLLGIFTDAQTQVYFKYDEAGNQRYRGPDTADRAAADSLRQAAVQKVPGEEDKFWAQVSAYPVPVKDLLTIRWDTALDELIDSVSLYQHTLLAWDFQQKNLPSLNRQVQVDMSRYYMGVYVLSFTLKDGRVYSRNIIKE